MKHLTNELTRQRHGGRPADYGPAVGQRGPALISPRQALVLYDAADVQRPVR